MADRKKIVKENVEGDFFVDTTCIDCDTCRQIAPESFKDAGEYSYVWRQPGSNQARRRATQALLSCPTGSIGCENNNIAREVINDFPLMIEDDVFYCGFNSPKSYGGNSYFIKNADGNWLVDAPKFNQHLVKRIEEYGGLKYIFLTHEDDVADADRFANHFKAKAKAKAKAEAKRIIHKDALTACPDAEIVIESEKQFETIPEDFRLIHTPGHTKGHMVLLYRNKFLFTGDHLHFSRDTKHLEAFRDYCWYSWSEQTKSMKTLIDYDFEWVLPGHGQRVKLSRTEAREQLEELTREMTLR
jgi:glyoxylase-like metal-dependent hydrolase (beta-lactamase superfamily II)/ferredoxin